ncbi:hypothetical protein AMTR_s00181p00046330 [Amborella trichopoda]|uniref:Uncharacterized protein n=1 Tax=Amborella trichopoda TaxID=13333 RepID=W1NZL5_AMBTC|nr:hypothetical protein AMTR_s00181p00046330 [Amborella trichopoda]
MRGGVAISTGVFVVALVVHHGGGLGGGFGGRAGAGEGIGGGIGGGFGGGA